MKHATAFVETFHDLQVVKQINLKITGNYLDFD